MITINIARDFSKYPAGRFTKDGPFSGETFRKKFLEPNIERHEKIVVELDGARGYGSSFLEEAFGGLVRKGIAPKVIKEKIEIQASNKSLITEILEFIDNAGGNQ